MKQLMLCLFSLAVVATADEKSLDDILRDGNNAFTAKMLTEVVKDKPGQSVVLSAFSVLTPLAQLALASVGESHDELLTTIGMPNDNTTTAVFSKVNTHLKSVKGVTLKAASKIYVSNKYEINQNFADHTLDIFGSEVENVDFTEKKKTVQEVNLWVEKQTNNLIKHLVDPSSLNYGTIALLVNAIYFKGLWEIPFAKDFTFPYEFHVSKTKLIQVPLMHTIDNYYKYIDSQELNAEVIELKYKGGESALYVVLPHEGDSITQLEEKLTDPSLLDNVINSMSEIKIDVYLPKFKIETTTDLKKVLENMNVKRLFSARDARLDKLLKGVKNGLYISDATQKVVIEVNEEGAVAAAANNMILAGATLEESPTPQFIANRPFYFVVKAKSLALFNGIYAGN